MRSRYIIIVLFVFIASCKNEKKPATATQNTYTKYRGLTMGTSYNLVFEKANQDITQASIDSILLDINQSVSTYIDSSTISKINNATKYGELIEVLINGAYKKSYRSTLPYDKHFITNYNSSQRIYLDSEGAFDPTIMPLVNYWGFGYKGKIPIVDIDSQKVQSILKYTGMDKINLESNESSITVVKPAGAELDFSAIAKGYAVDEVAAYLRAQSVTNMLVEIGGEAYAVGRNPKNSEWKIGLNTPKEDAALNDFQGIVKLDGQGLASSGNYRIYHVVGSRKYGHEINPVTGYPELNDLLAVSVLAPTCMEADATATALMVMGLDKAIKYVNAYHQLEACFFTSDSLGQIEVTYTEGLSKIVID